MTAPSSHLRDSIRLVTTCKGTGMGADDRDYWREVVEASFGEQRGDGGRPSSLDLAEGRDRRILGQ